ncbi:MAG: Rieske (2Fe-2S) protein [Alphaproteobacteria bacterium]|nr:Rieske (2Fe-2S) protein [Alphaproteobacteria bacterium]
MPRGLPDTLPAAWYCLGRAEDLAPGALESRVFCGEDVVLFRTESGVLSLASAWCPHMGAHLGKGGRVCGEAIECPFHAFRFAPDGACVDTPTHAPPKRAQLRTWPVMERDGLILAWHHPEGAAPDWEVQDLQGGTWWPMLMHRFELESHPQEITENSVDISHFSVVHGYDQVEVVEPIRPDKGPLRGVYRMARENPFSLGDEPIRVQMELLVDGLGVSRVNVQVLNYGFRYRLYVLPTPTRAGQIELRIAMTMARELDEAPRPLWMRALPEALLMPFVRQQAFKGALNDVQQDFEIWKNKVYLHPPVLSREDGPIVPYRRWCKQFYGEDPAQQSA